ncbi:hypothetical protein AAG906_014356 [Vitis piasezkii]
MARAFKKRVKPRPLRIGDLVLKVIRGLIKDPRGKELTQGCMVDGFRRKPIFRAHQCRSAKEVLRLRPWSQDGWPSFRDPSRVRCSLRIIITHITISSFCFICLLIDIILTLGILRAWFSDHRVFGPSFLSFLLPYHPSLRSSARSLSLLGYFNETWAWSLPYGAPRSIRLVPHFSTLGCHHASLSGGHLRYMCMIRLWIRMTSITCSTIDDFIYEIDVRLMIRFHFILDTEKPLLSLSAILLYDRGSWASYVEYTDPHVTILVDIAFASLTIILELFIDMSSQRSVVRDS